MTATIRTALKETWLILITWCVFCAWVILSCAQHYQADVPLDAAPGADPSGVARELVTVWGLPAWVFWGIALPWLTATTFTVLFALLGLKPDPDVEHADA